MLADIGYLKEYQHWKTSEEEYEEYASVFLQEFLPMLPGEVKLMIADKVVMSFLPFGACSLPDCYNLYEKKLGVQDRRRNRKNRC